MGEPNKEARMQLHTQREKDARTSQRPAWQMVWAVCLSILMLTLGSLPSLGQTSTGNITGTVEDKTGAVIPNASVTLTNVQTDDTRKTVSNGSGLFYFAAVPVGTYKVAITATGFSTFTATDIIMHSGEGHVIPDIQLPLQSANVSMDVTASQAAVIPLDNGASSTTLNDVLVDKLEIQGRDAAELVKFMPAMAMNTGLGQTSFSSLTTSTNSGPIGQFSSAGTQPYGSMQMTLDGASLVDVGNQGTQIANVNQDSTKEFTFLNAAFGADTPRGPTVIQITSKSGGQSFHGDAYVYARNWQANANDAYFRENNQARPGEHQTYVGGTLGGPVILPHVNFNRNRDKLFFFAAYEKMMQNPFPTLHKTVTPTSDWINGNFSAETMAPFINSSNSWWPTLQVPCADAPNWTSYCPVGGANPIPGGQISNAQMDPDGKALLTYLNKINQPNVDPSTHDGYNFYYLDNSPVNRWEARGRGDYDPTENDKISVVYTKQNEADINKFCVWWCPGDTGLSPSPLNATTKADLWTANYTRVIGASMTNELSFFRTYFTFPPAFTDPAAMNVSAAGYTTFAPFGVPSAQSFEQLPSMVSWGCSISTSAGCFDGIYVPAMMKDFNNAFGNIKKIYAVQDNFTKLLGKHSLKAGIFWDRNNQVQTTSYGNWTQGLLDFEQYATFTTNNPYADMLLGHTDSLSQVSDAPTHDMSYYEYAFYVQDQWKMTNKLTLDLGVRVEHEGNWAPTSGAASKTGIAVWNPALYDDSSSAPAWTGMEWHGSNSKIPLSGFTSKLFYPDPRVGFAYDTHGNGKIVVRGGIGLYRWQFSEGDVDSGLSPGLNVSSIATPSTTSFAQLASFAPGSSSWCATNYTCPSVQVMKNEDKTPYTLNWDAMVDTELPGHMVFELQYIGNSTRNALLGGNGSTAYFNSNINKIPLGGLYGTDTIDGINHWQTTCATGPCTIPASNYYGGYVPYKNYSTLYLIQHGSYSNYNGMVAALQKQTGRQTFIVNYTFSKVMGIRDGQSDNGTGDGAVVNGFDLRSNYGPLNYDHTHIFNAAYYLSIPGFKNYGEIVKAVTNGWALSGTYQFQSGAPIQSNTGGNLNANWTTGTVNGNAASAAYLLGTNGENLVPYLTCDPRLGGGRFFNASCFQTPNILGKNGPTVWPYIKGPAYQDADLTAARTFKIVKEQTLEFRASAFNFLNHPLEELGDGSDLKLSMSCNGPAGVAGCPAGGSNTNDVTNGNAAYHRGRRVVEATVKYYF
jgi:hypothetical protein